jgi:tetratricopeptide (TPR) repeat protein
MPSSAAAAGPTTPPCVCRRSAERRGAWRTRTAKRRHQNVEAADAARAIKSRDFALAISVCTKALQASHGHPLSDQERVALLVRRAHAYFCVKQHEKSRADTASALLIEPYHCEALFQLSDAEKALGRPKAAITALCLGAAHHPSQYEAFAKAARALGGWKLPPPLRDEPASPDVEPLGARSTDVLVERIVRPTRDEFMRYVRAGKPVVVQQFAPTSGWTYGQLTSLARTTEAEGVVGDVIVSASGCVPDYARPAGRLSETSPQASKIEAMRTRKMGLPEVLTRVFGAEAAKAEQKADRRKKKSGSAAESDGHTAGDAAWADGPAAAVPIPEAARVKLPGEFCCGGASGARNANGEALEMMPPSSCTSRADLESEQVVEEVVVEEEEEEEEEDETAWGSDEWHTIHEKIYAYGDNWMLKLPWLRAEARTARPTFFKLEDLTFGEPLDPVADLEVKNCVGWVSSKGCLTPMHWDMTDGVLAQMVGKKRVWLYDWRDHESMYLRGRGSDSWERQSGADLHGDGAAENFPKLHGCRRYRADLTAGELLYIPSNWLHEVHARTPSFSLGWRFAMVQSSGQCLMGVSEGRCPNQIPATKKPDALCPNSPDGRAAIKMNELRKRVSNGEISEDESLSIALDDPEMRAWLERKGMPGI